MEPLLLCPVRHAAWLFDEVGPSIPAWTGMYLSSTDEGRSWTSPTAPPAGLLGPAKNKPVLLSNVDIVCGTSNETFRSWACWVEISRDGGASWSRHGPIIAPSSSAQPQGTPESPSAIWDARAHKLILPQQHSGVIQPTVWEAAAGRLKMLMRATRRVGFVCSAESDYYGRTWSETDPHSSPTRPCADTLAVLHLVQSSDATSLGCPNSHGRTR